jgi:hypothetical protein
MYSMHPEPIILLLLEEGKKLSTLNPSLSSSYIINFDLLVSVVVSDCCYTVLQCHE